MNRVLTAVRSLAELEETGAAEYTTRHAERREWAIDQGFRRLDPSQLERYFEINLTTGDITEWDGLAFLPPPRQGPARLPLATLQYDFDAEPPTMDLQIASLMVDDGPDGTAISYGYRYETPEARGAEGKTSNHGYFHAQPLREVRTAKRGAMRLPGCPAAFPDDAPTFPLDCDDPLGLLLCAVVSIYGVREFAEINNRHFNGDFHDRLVDMRCLPQLEI